MVRKKGLSFHFYMLHEAGSCIKRWNSVPQHNNYAYWYALATPTFIWFNKESFYMQLRTASWSKFESFVYIFFYTI